MLIFNSRARRFMQKPKSWAGTPRYNGVRGIPDSLGQPTDSGYLNTAL